MILKTDGEAAIIRSATRQCIATRGNEEARDPPAIGTLKMALEDRLGLTIDKDSPIMEWMTPHAAFI